MSSSAFRPGDIVSYKYNGLRGTVLGATDNHVEVVFASQNSRDGKITATLSHEEIELVSGGVTAALPV